MMERAAGNEIEGDWREQNSLSPVETSPSAQAGSRAQHAVLRHAGA
jgi:hypothetical protein